MPYVQGSVKELNRKTVFEIITEQYEITRIGLVERTQSSMPTIMKITDFFLEQKMIAPVGIEKTARGRRPQVYRFEPDSLLGIGISYDGNRAVVSLANYYGKELYCIEENITDSFENMMDKEFPRIIKRLVSPVNRETVKSVGICMGGSVDTDQVEVHMGGYSELSIKRDLRESVNTLSQRIGLPVYLFNDVNSAAIGEYVLRRMKNEDLIYIYVGEGTGAGVILNGSLREGQHFYTGEVAHMVFDADYVINPAKPGWMEVKLSKDSIERSALTKAERIDYAARYISLVIANICGVMDVENVVLGGETVQEMESELLERTKKYLSHLLLFPVKLTRFVNDHSALIGGARLALERQLTNILADSDETKADKVAQRRRGVL